jgi:protocatechuate 3,4-dioxygenase beta subunit
VDGMPERVDVRTDLVDGSVKDGVPVRLLLAVYRADVGGCAPLTDARIDIWSCDAEGKYSEDPAIETVGRAFLRGGQVVDERGAVEFRTIYPGWYPGRTSHIHFKVRTSADGQITYDFTSQLYFVDAISNEVLTQWPYTRHGPKDTTNERDGFYINRSADGRVPANMGAQLMLDLSRDTDGYVGRFTIVLEALAASYQPLV